MDWNDHYILYSLTRMVSHNYFLLLNDNVMWRAISSLLIPTTILLMSELASQRVFNLLDLVEIICEHTSVRAPDGEFLDKKPLKNLAKVNRVARHAALWRLWRNVNGLDKILSLLPPERDLVCLQRWPVVNYRFEPYFLDS